MTQDAPPAPRLDAAPGPGAAALPRTPNFFIVGAPKCGTTSLAAWLSEHPNVYLAPVKEPWFFSSDIRNRRDLTWAEYLSLFARAGAEHAAIGEASTTYLYSRAAVPAIERTFPGARYIAMLRNPVAMAVSYHQEQLRGLKEDVRDFRQAWALAPERRAGRRLPRGCSDGAWLDYPNVCRLGSQLQRLYDTVPRDRVLVLLLDDLTRSPEREYGRVLRFLGLPPDGRTDFSARNVARSWRSARLGAAVLALGRLRVWLRRRVGWGPRRGTGLLQRLQGLSQVSGPAPALPGDLARELEAYFRDDVLLLERLLGRDLSAWRAPSGDAP